MALNFIFSLGTQGVKTDFAIQMWAQDAVHRHVVLTVPIVLVVTRTMGMVNIWAYTQHLLTQCHHTRGPKLRHAYSGKFFNVNVFLRTSFNERRWQ
jgi:hypothetical protein